MTDQPKMSAVILELAAPLLKKYGESDQRIETIVCLTVAAWNKAMMPPEAHDDLEKSIINTLVPDGDSAELVGFAIHFMDTIDARRKELFPELRKFIPDYKLEVRDGMINLNVVSTAIGDIEKDC